MALRNSPYLPLYVQDFACDEKLIECSAAATGVYIRIMCIMHKSEDYGKVVLKDKDLCYIENSSEVDLEQSFTVKLMRHMPYQYKEIKSCLKELVDEGVLCIEGNALVQKRMVKDSQESLLKSKAGYLGGKKKAKSKAKQQAETLAESEAETLAEFEAKQQAESEASFNIDNSYNNNYNNYNNNDNTLFSNNDTTIREVNYEKIRKLYNSTCISLPKKRAITDQLKPKVRCRLREMEEFGRNNPDIFGIEHTKDLGYKIMAYVFAKAEQSRFIREGTFCSFDWIFTNDHNWLKILEGNYDDRQDNKTDNRQREQRLKDIKQGFFSIMRGEEE